MTSALSLKLTVSVRILQMVSTWSCSTTLGMKTYFNTRIRGASSSEASDSSRKDCNQKIVREISALKPTRTRLRSLKSATNKNTPKFRKKLKVFLRLNMEKMISGELTYQMKIPLIN